MASGLTRSCRAGLFAVSLAVMIGGHAMGQQAGKHAKTGKRTKMANQILYVGTYMNGKSIYLLELDATTGALKQLGTADGGASPSFLAIHPNGRYLYAVNEVGDFEGSKAGAVSAFAIQPKTGHLTRLNQESSKGDGPCHIWVDSTGKNALVANYGGGSIAVLPIHADGKLGRATEFIQNHGSSVDHSRQEGPHAHSVTMDPANKFAIEADLGLDKLLVYRLDTEKGTLTPNEPPFTATTPGSGPRHCAFSTDGRYLYGINEMGNTVTAYTYDAAQGTLQEFQTISTLPTDFTGENTTAEIVVHPSGKFLYGSNRGHNSIAIFAIDAGTGNLRAIGHQSTEGKTPRNFAIDPSGTFLIAANQDSNSLVVFRIDPQTGMLTPTGHHAEVPKPVCIRMIPAEK